MAEQERYSSHWSSNSSDPVKDSASVGVRNLVKGSGAEQDRYASHFSLVHELPPKPERSASRGHMRQSLDNPLNTTASGIFRSVLIPSIGFHSGLALAVYTASRAANRVEGKDWLWPSGQVLNAWWSAIGTRVVYDNVPLNTAWSMLIYSEKLLLAGVTAWGARLFYRIASRSMSRGRDDPRYETVKGEPGFWTKALFSVFLPEAVFQAIISLPFTLPFRAVHECALASPVPACPELAHSLAVFIFSSGFALEVLADAQLASHQKTGSNGLNREGVWSIARHPNYLGDALIHASFPVLLYSAGLLHPLALLGPVANYMFLRCVGGDKENEANQSMRYLKEDEKKYGQWVEYTRQKNSFWPKVDELFNPWLWKVLAAGVTGVILESGIRIWYGTL